MKYYIITFGCQMNKSDSERIASNLEAKGYEPAQKENEADLIVVNMCSVRQSAVDRVYGLIPKLEKLKAKNKKFILRQTQDDGERGRTITLRQAQDDGEHGRTIKTILTGCVLKKDKQKFAKSFDQILRFEDLLKYPPKYRSNSIAFVPISNGCNNFCTYCVVPLVRGPLVCRDHEEILKEVKNLIKKKVNPIRGTTSNPVKNQRFLNGANGAREIWLLGQNVNDYQSPTESSINFAKLLKMVNDVPGNFQFYFISSHPKPSTRANLGAGLVPHPEHINRYVLGGAGNFSWDELINTLAQCGKFGKYLNLPVQSGDNKILKKMNRPYTIEQYKKLIKKIREKIPEIHLSTDVIVGFPGETKKQFENTVKLFKEIKFNMAYISKYSPRPGTAAFQMENDIPLIEKKRREKILRQLITLNHANSKP